MFPVTQQGIQFENPFLSGKLLWKSTLRPGERNDVREDVLRNSPDSGNRNCREPFLEQKQKDVVDVP